MAKIQVGGEQLGKEIWEAAHMLTSLNSDQRDRAIDLISQIKGFQDSELIAYLLVSRLTEPDLEVRFHLIQLLGCLLDFEGPGPHFPDQVLRVVHYELTQLTQYHFERILEVASEYLSAERAVKNILKLCSYAGHVLSGIVNDRKQPFQIRQQAVFFCGEMGYLETRAALKNLVRRVEKARKSSVSTRSRNDDERLLTYAVAAISKLET